MVAPKAVDPRLIISSGVVCVVLGVSTRVRVRLSSICARPTHSNSHTCFTCVCVCVCVLRHTSIHASPSNTCTIRVASHLVSSRTIQTSRCSSLSNVMLDMLMQHKDSLNPRCAFSNFTFVDHRIAAHLLRQCPIEFICLPVAYPCVGLASAISLATRTQQRCCSFRCEKECVCDLTHL